MLGTFTDITERKRTEVVSAAERDVLDLLSTGEPLTDVLARLATCYEEVFPGTMISILRLDEEGTRLRPIAAPHLPPSFFPSENGLEIGPDACTWGAAAYTGRVAEVADIQTDPLPAECQELALTFGLRSCCAAPVVSSGGRVLGTFATFRRVPHRTDAAERAILERCARFAALAIERHQLSQSLQESQVRLKTLVGNLPGMAYRCLNDAHWTMTYCSDGCEPLTGFTRDELESNRLVAYADLIHPDDRDALWAKCQASLDARVPCQNDYRIIDRQGRERWVSERASGHYAESGELLSIDGFIQDITESRQHAIERGLLERKMLETQKLESLGVLAGGIAHDFNNILSGILGNASLGVAQVSAGAPEEEYFLDIAESARRAADLCRQMLAYAGKGRFIVRALDLSQLVDGTTPMLRLSVSKSALLRFHLEANLPAVEGDATQIRQVLMNLIINASEAIGESSGVISVSTGMTYADRALLGLSRVAGDVPEGNYVYLEVSDSGAGMPSDTLDRIFDPFFSTKFTGRGLGLAAVLGIVRGHRGALTLISEVGKGTTFRILFPVATGPVDPVSSSPQIAAAWRGEGTVLVVDDEDSVRSITGRMLRATGFDVVLAADGQSAVEIFRDDPTRFALVMLDLTMPGRNGEDVIEDLLALHPDARVMLMSGFTEQDTLTRFPRTGSASFLQKPFSYESLREAIKSVLLSQPRP